MEKMYLISKDELFDLLVAWHRINCGDCYGIDNWPGWDYGRQEYLEEWCRENEIPYEEDFSFEKIAKYELKNYEETELAWT